MYQTKEEIKIIKTVLLSVCDLNSKNENIILKIYF